MWVAVIEETARIIFIDTLRTANTEMSSAISTLGFLGVLVLGLGMAIAWTVQKCPDACRYIAGSVGDNAKNTEVVVYGSKAFAKKLFGTGGYTMHTGSTRTDAVGMTHWEPPTFRSPRPDARTPATLVYDKKGV